MQIRLLLIAVAASASLASTFVMAHPGKHDSDDDKLIPKTCEQLADAERYFTDVAYPEVRKLTEQCDTAWRDEMRVVLQPGQGVEVKLSMKAGEQAQFSWVAEGGVVNFDTHGDGGGQSISYEKGRAVPADDGVLKAAFDGSHGWFWRNRGNADVTVIIRARGQYTEMKRVL